MRMIDRLRLTRIGQLIPFSDAGPVTSPLKGMAIWQLQAMKQKAEKLFTYCILARLLNHPQPNCIKLKRNEKENKWLDHQS